MQRQTILVTSVLAAIILIPESATAQFSLTPRGIVGAVTRPLRELLGHHHHAHRIVRHHQTAHETRAASREAQAVSTSSQPDTVDTPIWPDAYTQVVGYVFWPSDYRQKLQQHGFGDIAIAVIGPLPSQPATVGTASRDTDETDATADNARNGGSASAQPCASGIDDNGHWPADKIERTIKLDDAQRGALEKLRAAYINGAKTIKADCRNLGSLSPTRRLEAMEQRLWAVRDAGVLIREPLRAFYESLNDDQKAKFAAIWQEKQRDANDANDAAMKGEQQECFGKETGETQRFLKQVQQTVHPTEKQRASFDVLRKKSSDMARLLMASCMQASPATPLERLDAADTRLTAMNYAATTVDIALNDFYGRLSQDQKAKFDAMGR